MSSPSNQDQDGTDRPRWLGWALAGIVGATLLATALWLCVAVLPQRLYPTLSHADLAGLTPAEQAERREGRDKLQNDARTTLLQGLAALLVLSGAGIGAAVTLRQVRIGREQLKVARDQAEIARQQAQDSGKQAREQLAIALQGQVTDRFTRAIDQLGSATLDVRLGGIYALERIARDSPNDQATIIEVLSAYIRQHSPWPPPWGPDGNPPPYPEDMQLNELPSLQARAADIQAAMTVLGRLPRTDGDRPPELLATDLRKADLVGTDLTRAKLSRSSLAGARLDEARLSGATLFRANLGEAVLEKADLSGAQLSEANLAMASLEKTNLAGSSLLGANLASAYLKEASLARARASGAKLVGTILIGANLERTSLARANLDRADLTKASLGRTDLTGSRLPGANLTEAKLPGADLTGAALLGANFAWAQLDEAKLNGAKANRETVWPDGWDRARRAAAGVVEPDD